MAAAETKIFKFQEKLKEVYFMSLEKIMQTLPALLDFLLNLGK